MREAYCGLTDVQRGVVEGENTGHKTSLSAGYSRLSPIRDVTFHCRLRKVLAASTYGQKAYQQQAT